MRWERKREKTHSFSVLCGRPISSPSSMRLTRSCITRPHVVRVRLCTVLISTPCRHYRPILRTLSRNHATHGTNAPSNFRPSENGCNLFWSNTFETTHKQDEPRLSETSRNFSQIVQNQQHIFSIFPLLRGQRHHLNRSLCEGNWIIMGAGSHQDCSGSINLSDQRIKSSSRRRSVPSHPTYLRILSISATTTSPNSDTILSILPKIILPTILPTIFLPTIGLKASERRRSIVSHNTVTKAPKKIEILGGSSS